jgi:hypothetical protein
MTQVMNLCLFGSASDRFEEEQASQHCQKGKEVYSFSGMLGMTIPVAPPQLTITKGLITNDN